MTESAATIIGTLIAFMLMFGIPILMIIAICLLYRKTKKQEVEIAVLTERLRNYEKKPFSQTDFEHWKKDQGGYVDLDVLAGLLRSRSV